MNPDEIRSTFFDFFGDRGHLLLPPSSVVSSDDSLLFTNAGMNQFRPYYLGERPPPHRRLMSSQPCVRTVDIDNIGYTTRHSTSFEMLGNFAFSDYFKLESMSWALKLLTDGFGLDRDRLWVTVFSTDDESFVLWQKLGFPTDRIQRLGIEDNYWSMGVPGPGGPNSELFYDRGPSFGRSGGPSVNSERYLELWNLVFMQDVRGNSDEEILGPLPGRHVDTGLGLSRLQLVLSGGRHVQELDPLLPKVRELTGSSSPSVRIVVDHLRTSLLLLDAGVAPGNDGRSYVLRRLLRRAMRHLHLLGVTDPVLGQLIGHPLVSREERAFTRTLVRGQNILQRALDRGSLPVELVFKLHETHGFPVELTEEIARERGFKVDRAGFDTLMASHRSRS
ncbi:alanine--tRNA ligase-related protein [Catelliglobosispora koreensis]|uniref:alanine--tRNA ligase-related protein n=1 Tax=Catelliglobosispora koreensis TaxID=129052 RepID=UPI00036C3959|nr:alanine--tRNA ligase-related protein [Catelliglobosispora koreensis]